MNIRIIKDESMPSDLTGGEYAVANVVIYVDPDLDIRTQRLLVIHSILENYFRSLPHSKIEELMVYLEEGLDLLDESP